MTNLDLNKFPAIENVSGLLKYDPFKEFSCIHNLGNITERIYGCAKFVGAKPDENHPYFAENAHLRAFLSEFSSLNEVLKGQNQLELNNITIENTDYPIFHFLKLLRNVNFHVKTISGGTTSFQAIFQDKRTKKCWGDEMTITRYIIDDCNWNLLQNARDIKHYDRNEIQQTIDWVDKTQKEHGISDVLEGALRQYCKLIESTVVNKKQNTSNVVY